MKNISKKSISVLIMVIILAILLVLSFTISFTVPLNTEKYKAKTWDDYKIEAVVSEEEIIEEVKGWFSKTPTPGSLDHGKIISWVGDDYRQDFYAVEDKMQADVINTKKGIFVKILFKSGGDDAEDIKSAFCKENIISMEFFDLQKYNQEHTAAEYLNFWAFVSAKINGK